MLLIKKIGIITVLLATWSLTMAQDNIQAQLKRGNFDLIKGMAAGLEVYRICGVLPDPIAKEVLDDAKKMAMTENILTAEEINQAHNEGVKTAKTLADMEARCAVIMDENK